MTYLESIKTEYRRYKKIAEGAIEQISDDDLTKCLDSEGNSVSIIVGHISGNLKSRFTDFLSSDGEKPWRDREQEFLDKGLDRSGLLKIWEEGWCVLFETLDNLSDSDLDSQVFIRKTPLSVTEALNRSLAHTSYHVGQITLLARAFLGNRWQYLSIPKGQSEEYNRNPTLEKGV